MHQISVSEGPKYFSRMGYHEKGSSGPKIQTVNYTGPSVALIRCICANFKRIIAKLVFQGPFCLHLNNLRFAFMDPSSRPHDDPLLVSIYVVWMRLFGQFVQMGAIKNPIKPKKWPKIAFLGL